MNPEHAMKLASRFVRLPLEKRRMFLDGLRREAIDFAVFPIPSGASEPGRAELSYAQQRMWFAWQLAPTGSAYHIPMAVRLLGPLDRAALLRAFDELLQRHESLRTGFFEDEQGVYQQVLPKAELSMQAFDLSALEPAERESRLAALSQAQGDSPFDLAQPPLLRAALVRLGSDEQVLLLTLHHIVADGWSMNLLISELIGAYERACGVARAEPAALPIQYRDFALWQRQWLEAGGRQADLDYWLAHLGDTDGALRLPLRRARSAGEELQAARLEIDLDPTLTARLKALAGQEQVTLFMLLLAAYKLLLQRYGGQRSIRVAVPVANRNRAEVEGLIGCFINTQLLQTELDPELDRRALLARIKATALGAQAHQDLPFETLVRAMGNERQGEPFQALFNHQAQVLDVTRLQTATGLVLEALPAQRRTCHCELMLESHERGDQLQARFTYAAELFEPATIEQMAGHWRQLLEQLVAATPGPVGDWALATAEAPTVSSAFAEVMVDQLIDQAARRQPQRLAVVSAGQSLSYSALAKRAERLAIELQGLGVGPETLVAVLADRSVQMVAAILAVLKAGAAYLPLDPELPRQRQLELLRGAGVKVLIANADVDLGCTRVALDQPLGETTARLQPLPARWPAQLAYVIYTSGSTGQPKGVGVSHGALVNYLEGIAGRLPLAEVEQLAMVSTPAADLGHTVFFSALCQGKTLHLLGKEQATDADAMAAYLSEQAVDLLKIVPSHLQALLRAEGSAKVLPRRCLVLGGEAPGQGLLASVRAMAPNLELVNHYGPTETTVGVLTANLSAADAVVELGQALPGTCARVLDAGLAQVPEQGHGELYIGGACLARGYMGQPGLTAERFVPDPQGQGERLYRSGDRIRRAAGLRFDGRGDGQVKIRGYRVELGEVNSRLLALAEVASGCVRVHEGRLLAWAVPASTMPDFAARVRQALAACLPQAMVPEQVIELACLPLTGNGKVDSKALPLPEQDAGAVRYRPAETPLQQCLAHIWAEVLERTEVGLDDGFFELGGHSLLATQVISRARRALGLEIPLRSLFDSPDLEGFCVAVQGLAEQGRAASDIPRLSREQALPLSHAQHRQWLFWKLQPESSAYHTPLLVRLSGVLDVPALEQSLQALVDRHETLRTLFEEQAGVPMQRVLPRVNLVLAQQAAARDESALHEQIEALVREPFDLARGPLIRATLLRQGGDQALMVLVLHHIVSDGWSMGVMVRECLARYNAVVSGQPLQPVPLAVHYADYAAWQREQLASPAVREQLDYWKALLQDDLALLDLPADRPRPPRQSHRGERVEVRVPAELVQGLRQLAVQANATLFHVFLGVFAVVLGRHAGRERLNIGVPMTNRNRLELEGLIGFFVNSVVHRIELDNARSFDDLLARVKEQALQAQANKDVPFDQVVEQLQPERGLDHNPLFQVMYNHLRDVGARVDGGSATGLRIEEVPLPERTAQFDLTLDTLERSDGVLASFNFALDLFDRARIEQLAEHWLNALRAALASPGQAIGEWLLLGEPGLEASVYRAQPAGWRQQATIHGLIEERAAANPEALALWYQDRHCSYAQLNARGNQLARGLQARGVGAGSKVAVALPRTPDLVAALLAIFKLGAAYIPLDLAYPQERLAYMLEDSQAGLLLTSQHVVDSLALQAGLEVLALERLEVSHLDVDNLPAAAGPESLAYVIYTSGSTGRPKGVMIEHRNLCALIGWSAGVYEDLQGVLASTSICFDLSAWELFVTLALGGSLVLADNALHLPQLPARERVRLVNTVPSAIRALCEAGQIPASVRVINLAGEPLAQGLVEDLYRLPGVERVFDLYGPSEDTTYSTCTLRQAGGQANIGTPIDNTVGYILDQAGQVVQAGWPGELYLGGAGLSRGYLGRAALTAEKFVPDPFSAQPGQRVYRTGDQVRRNAEGVLEYLGRLDHQVKIRGFRIELGEIESRLVALPVLAESTLLAVDTPTGKQLVAYLVPRDPAWLQAAGEQRLALFQQIRQHLQQTLPEYMLPSQWVLLDRLPQTPNGKLDRKALPAPELDAGARRYRAPASELECQLAAVWSQVLGLERVGLDDNFFELGGHSLLATRVSAQVQAQLGLDLPLSALFQARDLAAYAEGVAACLPGSRADLDELEDLLSYLETS